MSKVGIEEALAILHFRMNKVLDHWASLFLYFNFLSMVEEAFVSQKTLLQGPASQDNACYCIEQRSSKYQLIQMVSCSIVGLNVFDWLTHEGISGAGMHGAQSSHRACLCHQGSCLA
jgi:hypothetical protein